MQPYRIIAKFVLVIFFCGAWAAGAQPARAPKPETPVISQARELIDTYYGNTNLVEASKLLEVAYKADPGDAHVFLQAARVVAMGGFLSYENYRPNTFERYGELLDKAIALDDSNVKAHILKAQVFERSRQYARQLAELDKAKALGTRDPWLLIGYADYYKNTNSLTHAHVMYSTVESEGPGTTASERKAYVAALSNLKNLLTAGENAADKLRKYAALATKARYPTDAWTPQVFAEDFISFQLFDEAIPYAREALKTMEFGAGKFTLAASLYGRAAQLELGGRPPSETKPFIDEAKKLRLSREALLEYFERRNTAGELRTLMPILTRLIPK
jgi:tetratricopeptide (TPR) repeat protein